MEKHENKPIGKVTTFDGMKDKITNNRRDGNTTRLVDNAIQIIYSGKICVVLDHHEMGRNKDMNKRLFNLIMQRLQNEHRRAVDNGVIIHEYREGFYEIRKNTFGFDYLADKFKNK